MDDIFSFRTPGFECIEQQVYTSAMEQFEASEHQPKWIFMTKNGKHSITSNSI